MPSLYFADLPNAARLGKVLGGELGGVGGRGAHRPGPGLDPDEGGGGAQWANLGGEAR